jgi:hypothetical protein
MDCDKTTTFFLFRRRDKKTVIHAVIHVLGKQSRPEDAHMKTTE